MENNFQWTDELVQELFYFRQISWPTLSVQDRIKEFKKSKEVKKDYEILSLKNTYGLIFTPDKNGKIRYAPFSDTTIENALQYQDFKIQSIKRISDGEVFTVGDITQCGAIDNFWIDNNGWMNFHTKEGNGGTLASAFKSKKQKLFTTEDGVDVFERYCEVYGVGEKFDIYNKLTSNVLSNPSHKIKWFSTKETRSEYILLNKPIQVSYKELVDYLSAEGGCFEPPIRKFFKSKIQP